jgi:hypothetical protein
MIVRCKGWLMRYAYRALEWQGSAETFTKTLISRQRGEAVRLGKRLVRAETFVLANR